MHQVRKQRSASMQPKLAKKDGEERISSAIHHILSNNHSDGHCYLTKGQIKTRIYKLINIESKQKINEILDKEELEENIVCVPVSKSDGLD